MKLSELFNTLPPESVFRNHLNGDERTAKEWAERLKNEPDDGYKVHDSKFNYGTVTRKTIYYPGVGQCFTEMQ